jgi:chromosomal replication initiation ATPase DnaA
MQVNKVKEKMFEIRVDRVVDVTGVTREELFSKTKEPRIVDSRQILYFSCSLKMNIRDIEILMCNNGYEITHSTIIHGIKSAKRKKRKIGAFSHCLSKTRR